MSRSVTHNAAVTVMGLLPRLQEATLFQFLDAISKLLNEEQSTSDLDKLEQELNVAMALMERDFPCVIQVHVYYF